MMRERTAISERRACALLGLSRSVLHYEARVRPADAALQARLVELAQERRRFGYRRLHALLRREGIEANHKRVHRLYLRACWVISRREETRKDRHDLDRPIHTHA
jgi:putative transposase